MVDFVAKSRSKKVRDISRLRPISTGGNGGIAGSFRPSLIDGRMALRTRNGDLLDMRTTAAKRFMWLVESMVEDLGGEEQISTAEFESIMSAAALMVDIRFEIAAFINGDIDQLDTERVVPLMNVLNRTLSQIGLKRRARDVTPRLADVLDGTAREVAE